jgi:hypothetical protein
MTMTDTQTLPPLPGSTATLTALGASVTEGALGQSAVGSSLGGAVMQLLTNNHGITTNGFGVIATAQRVTGGPSTTLPAIVV